MEIATALSILYSDLKPLDGGQSLNPMSTVLPLRFELVLKEKCMNQKAKPHKQSLVVGGQNGILVLGICRFAPEEFGNKD